MIVLPKSIFRVVRLSAVIFLFTALNLHAVTAQPFIVSKIIIENISPEFDLIPYVETFGEALKPFSAVAPTKFEFELRHDENDWSADCVIKLIWKNADMRGGGKKTNFEQRISLKIRQTFPKTFSIPVFYANNRTQKEMLRLENLESIGDQFQVYFRSHQIMTYFREVSGPQNARTRRAAIIFFNSAVRLAQQPDYIVNLAEEAVEAIREIYPESKIYQGRILEAKSMYWFDINLVDGLIRDRKCKEAKSLISNLSNMKERDKNTYMLRFSDDSQLINEKIKIFETECKE